MHGIGQRAGPAAGPPRPRVTVASDRRARRGRHDRPSSRRHARYGRHGKGPLRRRRGLPAGRLRALPSRLRWGHRRRRLGRPVRAVRDRHRASSVGGQDRACERGPWGHRHIRSERPDLAAPGRQLRSPPARPQHRPTRVDRTDRRDRARRVGARSRDALEDGAPGRAGRGEVETVGPLEDRLSTPAPSRAVA